VLSGIMRHAVLRGRIDSNPVQPVRVPQPKRRLLVEQSADGQGGTKVPRRA